MLITHQPLRAIDEPVRIDRLTAKDVPRLLRAQALFDRSLSEAAAREYLEDERNVLLFAVEGTTALGFLRGTALGQLASTRRQFFLYEIQVAPDARRKGVGRSLILALLRHCRSSGFEEVFVLTDPSNTGAVGLYRATGAVTETSADRMFVYSLAPRPADAALGGDGASEERP